MNKDKLLKLIHSNSLTNYKMLELMIGEKETLKLLYKEFKNTKNYKFSYYLHRLNNKLNKLNLVSSTPYYSRKKCDEVVWEYFQFHPDHKSRALVRCYCNIEVGLFSIQLYINSNDNTGFYVLMNNTNNCIINHGDLKGVYKDDISIYINSKKIPLIPDIKAYLNGK